MKKINNTYLYQAWKVTTIVLFTAFIALLMPYSSYAFGENCSADGYSGTCRDRNTTSCAGYYRSGVCPAPSNNQCCINSQISCTSSGKYGYCHNSSGGNTYSCTGGTWYPGVCPGPGDVTCCVLPPQTACGDAATPAGSIISNGVSTSASNIYNNDATNYGPANVVDGVINTKYWNAGGPPPPDRWIEINLGQVQPITGLKLTVVQNPTGNTIHEIYAGPTSNPTTLRRTLSCYTREAQVMNVVFNPPITDSKYIRITTTADPSWVAWREITVYGSAPGIQSQTPGVIFSGSNSTDFGKGTPSTKNWLVGGASYPEEYPTTTRPSETSYKYLLDKITTAGVSITDLTTVSGCSNLANCTLPSSPPLPNGVYQANGNLNLNAFTFPANKNYVFLINGNLTVLGSIVVPNGSTAFFSSSNDITIDRNVGTATNLFPLPAGQLQGIYSADGDFNIDGKNDCLAGADKMLNIEGAIITNALGNGGTFRTKRDLCGDNPNYPSLTVRLRLDFLLNMPEVLMKRSTTFSEDAP